MPENRFARYVEQEQGSGGNNRFARYVTSQPEPVSRGAAARLGFDNAISLGWNDEIARFLAGPEIGERVRQRIQNEENIAEATHPLSYFGGQLGGAVVGGAGAGMIGGAGVRAAGLAPQAARLAARVGPLGRIAGAGVAGAVGGGIYGAGEAEDGDRLMSAARGLIPGALGGAGGQVLGEVAGAGIRAIGRGMGPESAAASMISGAQRRFGQVGDNLTRDLTNAPEGAMVMDVIPGGPQLAAGASSRPSAQLPRIDRDIRRRNQSLAQQTIDDIWASLSGRPRGSASVTLQSLATDRARQAKPLYDRALNRRIDPDVAQRRLGEIVRRNPILFREAQDDIAEILQSEGISPADLGNPRYWHSLQKGADRAYERLRNRPGGLASEQRRTYGRALHQYRMQLRRTLGPEFGRAQDIWSENTRAMAAVNRGYEAVTPNANEIELGELAQEMRLMRPSELEHMRLGALSRLTDMIENAQSTTGRSNPVRSVLRSAGQRRVLQTLFGGQSQLDDVIRRIEQRQQLFENAVESGIGVNSHTANRAAARESQSAQTNPFRGGGLWDRVENFFLRGAADQWDEAVSNQLLRELRTPAPVALRAIQRAGGVEQWSRGRGLLAAAQKQALEQEGFRRNALRNALLGNFYLGAGGSGATSGGGY